MRFDWTVLIDTYKFLPWMCIPGKSKTLYRQTSIFLWNRLSQNWFIIFFFHKEFLQCTILWRNARNIQRWWRLEYWGIWTIMAIRWNRTCWTFVFVNFKRTWKINFKTLFLNITQTYEQFFLLAMELFTWGNTRWQIQISMTKIGWQTRWYIVIEMISPCLNKCFLQKRIWSIFRKDKIVKIPIT